MPSPSRRHATRALALILTAAAATTLATPAAAYIPTCGYLLIWYSNPAKTVEVGRRYVTPESCGCVEQNLGQPGNWYSVQGYNGCWNPE
jgi:hypothetical protein